MLKNTLFVILAVVAVFFLGVMAFGGQFRSSGTAIDAAAGLSNANLLSALNSIVTDLTAIRSPLSNVTSTSVTINLPSMNATSTVATTTAVTGAAIGDLVFVTPATSTGAFNDLIAVGRGCATDVVCLQFAIATTTSIGVDLPAVSYNLRLVPLATFTRPAALITSTSTSF